ncbi:MAG: hypothetical protein SFU25_07330 [Candidatus Caenarcaniphilales bacterium]|nr:hypothetical protein [Candidatus Caenarcaniphilales bacterium]
MNYDSSIQDWSKAPFYKEEDEIKLLISNYWIEFKNLKERHTVPMVETKFIDGKIRDYIALKVFQKESFLETVPEIILGPNFNNNNQPSLENFLQIQFNCSFDYEYLKPSLNEKPLKQNSEDKLTIFVSRGNPISIDRYKDESEK